MNYSFEELIDFVEKWAEARDIHKADDWRPQYMKIREEVREYSDELMHSESLFDPTSNIPNEMLEMGDIFVTLIIACQQRGYNPTACLNMAYHKIANRKGKTINGTFVKEEDL